MYIIQINYGLEVKEVTQPRWGVSEDQSCVFADGMLTEWIASKFNYWYWWKFLRVRARSLSCSACNPNM